MRSHITIFFVLNKIGFGVCVMLIMSCTFVRAHNSVVMINDSYTFYEPALNSAILIDASNNLKISNILKAEYQSKFKATDIDMPEFELVPFSIWIKFSIQSLLEFSPYLEIANPALDTIEYFLFNKEGQLVHRYLTGNFTKVNDRPIRSGQILIDMNLDFNTSYTCYLKINSRTSSPVVPMRIASLKKYYESTHTDFIWQGLYFGLILFIFIYNLFLFSSLKDPTYLYFALFIASMGLLFALFKGFGIQYLWSDFPIFNQFTPLLGSLAGIFVIMFSSSFLHSKVQTPKLHTWLLALIIFYIIIIGLNLASIQFLSLKLLLYNSTVVLIFLLLVGVRAWKGGFKPSKYYLLAWSFFVVGFITFILRENGLIKTNHFIENILQISSTVTILFMSFALSKKINIYIAIRNDAQDLALKTAIEHDKLISNQNQLLEAKVNQRTEDLEQTIATLSKQQKDLHEANNFKDKVFSIISHDLKSPISSLAGLLNVMKTKSLNEKEKVKVVDTLEQALKSTKYLLDNILAWAHKSDEKEIEEIEIYELTEEIFDLFSYQAELKSINLINNIEKGFHIEANKNMLQLVLRNLVSNAIKFTKRYGAVEISMKQDYLNLFLYIKDNGIGMSKEHMSNLFKANSHMSTRGTDNEKGTGLGLKLCKEFLDKYNGYLKVESTVGEGTTFIIKLNNTIPVFEATLN